MAIALRRLSTDDSAELADLYSENRAFLQPFEPLRDDGFFTEAGQRARLEQLVQDQERGAGMGWGICLGGALVGRAALWGIVRGPFESAGVGYWVSRPVNGRGIATTAMSLIIELAFGPLGLHRLEAATLPDNAASQRVLQHNGFGLIGTAPGYLRIAGRWQDHLLFQRLAP